MRPAAPTLDKLAILDERGYRKKIHPADVDGRFARLKPFVRWALIGIFVALPWIDVGGHPMVLFDLPMRRFYLLGHVLGTGDLPFLFFLLTATGWSLVVITTLYGRLWCGWACPQTVYLEGIFRRIERRIEGTAHDRLAFDLAPWTPKKAAKKVLKWALWLAASFITAHIFLSYFVSIPRMAGMLLESPTQHIGAFSVAAFATAITYFNFAWFREQTCLIICPYGRLQSAMQDRDSVVIGYDRARGEPRGKKSDPNAGDCVDCRRCVEVCPTGIDIRNGLQMECIGCAACVDACDDVMRKLSRKEGLVRYDSERGLAGEARRVFRPRLIAYLAAGAVGLVVLGAFAATRTAIVARITPMARAPWSIVNDGGMPFVQNAAMLHVENRSSRSVRLVPRIDAPQFVTVTAPMHALVLDAQERGDIPLLARVPQDHFTSGMHFTVRLDETDVAHADSDGDRDDDGTPHTTAGHGDAPHPSESAHHVVPIDHAAAATVTVPLLGPLTIHTQ